jgi:hypothetical protein
MTKCFFAAILALLCFSGFAQNYISRQQAFDDIDSFDQILKEVHYNPFLFIKEDQYHSKVAAFKKTVKDSISIKDFTLLLYRITALLKDGHTSPFFQQTQFKDDRSKEIFFPYAIVVDNGAIYVPKTTAALSGMPVGARINAINGRKVTTLAANLDQFIGGNAAYANEMGAKLFSYFLYLSNLTAPFTISYTDIKGNHGEKTIGKGLNFRDALAVNLPHIKKSYDFQIIDNKLGYLDFRGMNGNLNDADKYLDSCFTLLKKNNINAVAIDLRKNTGGNSVFGELLISYFFVGDYTLMGGRKWRVSQRYKDHLKEQGVTDHSYLQQENGTVWQLGDCKSHKPRFTNNNVYTGKVYLITGPLTFSSANMIADGAKQYKMCSLVGEPTGENTNDFGETMTFTLPNSKLIIQTTTSYDMGTDCNGNLHQPVMPDKLIRTAVADRINERDVVLKYLLKEQK